MRCSVFKKLWLELRTLGLIRFLVLVITLPLWLLFIAVLLFLSIIEYGFTGEWNFP